MRKLKSWQRAGLITASSIMLVLGNMSLYTAQAQEYKAEGWPVPDLRGREADATGYDYDKGIKYKYEVFLDVNGQGIIRLSKNGKVFAYAIDEGADGNTDYAIVKPTKDGKFIEKYDFSIEKGVRISDWMKKYQD